MIITIDGPTGTGKSTIAKLLAEKIGFVYFDTGAMYRCVTYGIIKHRIDLKNIQEINNFVDSFDFEVKVIKGVKRYFYENEDISDRIRGEAVTSLVSMISAMPFVREKLVKEQRRLGSQGANAVFEGRDMGTVVFPQADLKIYLTADAEARARRRYQELLGNKTFEGKSPHNVEAVLESVNKRDAYDTARVHSPLQKAEDAYIIDTTHMSIEEVLAKILEIVPEKPL